MHRGGRRDGQKVNEPGKKVDEPEKGDYEVLGLLLGMG